MFSISVGDMMFRTSYRELRGVFVLLVFRGGVANASAQKTSGRSRDDLLYPTSDIGSSDKWTKLLFHQTIWPGIWSSVR